MSCMKIVSINSLKKAKNRIKKPGNDRIQAACANLFLLCALACSSVFGGKYTALNRLNSVLIYYLIADFQGYRLEPFFSLMSVGIRQITFFFLSH